MLHYIKYLLKNTQNSLRPGSFIRPNECLGLCLRVLKQLSQKSKSSQLRHLNLGPFIGNIWHPSHLRKVKGKKMFISCLFSHCLDLIFTCTLCTWHQDVCWAQAPSLTAVQSSVTAEESPLSHPSHWHWRLDTNVTHYDETQIQRFNYSWIDSPALLVWDI